MVEFGFLADKLEFIEPLSKAIYMQWEDMYIRRGEDVGDLFEKTKQRAVVDTIPLTMVAYENEMLIGSVTIKSDDLAGYENINPWIAAVFVLPEFRNRGFGSQLVNFAERVAKEKFGFEKIFLYTASAHKLYKKLGYTEFDSFEKNESYIGVFEKNIA